MDEVILTTCPRDCYDACGIAVVKRDGAIHHVRGDRAHPVSRGRLCVKCSTAYNGVLRDSGARLLTPLRRKGPKPGGDFEPISWEQALAEVSARVRPLAGETVLNAHYTGTFALLGYNFPLRFFKRLGATEVDPDTICNKAGHVALDYLYGTSVDGFDPRTARDSRCIVVWGANPSASAPHQHEHWLGEADAEVIVVDPVRTPTAAAADVHLQPFPGSDAALAFALMHVIAREGLLDRELLAAHALGFEELEPLLHDCTAAWGERVTGVPASQIERAAIRYGTGPSLLWIGQGFQRQPRGGNAVRAVGLLPAVSGNVGRPGTGFLYLNGAGNRLLDDDLLAGARMAGEPVPEPISHMELAARLEDRDRSRALFCWNINIAASNPEQARLHAALAREDLFTVAIDLFATDTCDFADIVLPAASFLEHDDLVASYFHLSLGAQVKATEPLGESLPNTEIFRRLAAAMGYQEPELYESDAELIAEVLGPTGLRFDELAARGTVWFEPEPVIAVRRSAASRPRAAGSRSPQSARRRTGTRACPSRTPTRARRPGGCGCSRPPRRGCSTTASPTTASSRRRLGAATVAMHPADAAQRGLAAGDAVALHNSIGRLELTVALSDELPRGVVYSPKGRWPKREAARANVNALDPSEESDMGRSTTVHGVEVTLSRL